MDGFLVIDKPEGMTSHDVVAVVRRITGQRKSGHTGTLDPFATGVLPVALGEGTKTIPFLDEGVKEYRGTVRLGIETDTQDLTGSIIRETEIGGLTGEMVLSAAARFAGKQLQVPPMYSAVKKNGVPLYRLARKGASVERLPRSIEIYSFQIESVELPDVAFRVSCSRGTYVRTLASDLGEMLGVGGHLRSLRRTRSGPFTLDNALTVRQLQDACEAGCVEGMVMDPRTALGQLRELILDPDEAERLRNGIAPQWRFEFDPAEGGALNGEKVRLSIAGSLAAVAEVVCGEGPGEWRRLKLLRVFTALSPLHAPVGMVNRLIRN